MHCDGKIVYPTKADALKALRGRSSRRVGRKGFKGKLVAYSCACGSWHLGTELRPKANPARA